METDFIYWKHRTPIGVKVEEVSGGDGRSPAVWRAMAAQIWKENARDGYREVEHLDSGAPLLWGENYRISISHTPGLYVVASLPSTPEVDLSIFSERTAMGIDAERADREKVMNVRERFLAEAELSIVPASLLANITAWTCKEAIIKASLNPAIDWHNKILIDRLPLLSEDTPDASAHGLAHIVTDFGQIPFILYSYRTGEEGEFVVTLAITPHTATYSKQKNQKTK